MYRKPRHKKATRAAFGLLVFLLLSCEEDATHSVTISVEVELAEELPIAELILHEPKLLVRPKELLWDDPWLEIDIGLNDQVTLMEGGHPLPIALELRDLPEGDFEHIFLTGSSVTARDQQAQELVLENILEPIALVFSTRQGALPKLFLDLIVLEGIEQKGTYMIFAKDAGVIEGNGR